MLSEVNGNFSISSGENFLFLYDLKKDLLLNYLDCEKSPVQFTIYDGKTKKILFSKGVQIQKISDSIHPCVNNIRLFVSINHSAMSKIPPGFHKYSISFFDEDNDYYEVFVKDKYLHIGGVPYDA